MRDRRAIVSVEAGRKTALRFIGNGLDLGIIRQRLVAAETDLGGKRKKRDVHGIAQVLDTALCHLIGCLVAECAGQREAMRRLQFIAAGRHAVAPDFADVGA